MATFFYDTSAFVKYFTLERGSDKIISFIDDPANETWISELTLTEYYCALHRKYRNKEINEKQLNEAIEGFNEAVCSFNVEEITGFIFQQSRKYVLQYGRNSGLRTLDALQIAAFVLVAESDWTFVASDTIPCEIINTMGYHVINPLLK